MLYDSSPSLPTLQPAPRASAPRTIHVETTTRCNMRCGMCVKQSDGNQIPEGDLPFAVFQRLESDFTRVHSLVLNGIGEPLLHPDLERMIDFARRHMPEQGRIGFQTNGLALTETRTMALLDAGLDVICISADSVNPDSGKDVTHCGHPGTPERAMRHLRRAKRSAARAFRLGVECVLTRDGLDQLPAMVSWAGAQGADFFLVSHMLPFAKSATDQCLFNPNTREATRIFEDWRDRAKEEGLELQNYFKILWKFEKTDSERRLVEMVKEMQSMAAARAWA
ncbi:radical SAM protein [Desulfonatronum parangueonense]